jgi:glycosyltransferase involved in cell wall biosynthesis
MEDTLRAERTRSHGVLVGEHPRYESASEELPRTPVLLTNRVADWFGDHTGYQQLARYISELNPATRIISPRFNWRDRVVGKLYSTYRRWPGRNQCAAAAEFRFDRLSRLARPARHILFFDEHTWFLDRWSKAPPSIIGTIHLPPSRWPEEEIAYLRRLSSAIVLYTRDLDFFEGHVGPGRVRMIRHGVDTEFFRPATAPPNPTQILFAGHYLRNTEMLARVLPRLSERWPDLRFHLLVPEKFRTLNGLPGLARHPAVVWQGGLSDVELRDLIASSYLVLLPMNESGANNAIVEALSCGTPVVTTDVGGIRDYGGGSVFPIVPNNDDEALIALVERFVGDAHWRHEIARRCRHFAVTQLSWPLIAREHLAAYEALAA